MTKKDHIIYTLRGMLSEVKLNEYCLYDTIKETLTKPDIHHVVVGIKHRDVDIAKISFNTIDDTCDIEVFKRSEGYTCGNHYHFTNYDDDALHKEIREIERCILDVTLQATEVVMANRHRINLGTIDM